MSEIEGEVKVFLQWLCSKETMDSPLAVEAKALATEMQATPTSKGSAINLMNMYGVDILLRVSADDEKLPHEEITTFYKFGAGDFHLNKKDLHKNVIDRLDKMSKENFEFFVVVLFVSGPFFVQFACNCCTFFMPFPFLGWLLLRRARIRLTRLRCRRPQLKRKMGKSQSAKPRAQLRSLIPPPPRLRLRSTRSSYRCGVKSTLD